MSTKGKIYLVDGSGYIFRAFYAISALRTKEGFPTNALYGFTRMLLRLLKESDSEHVVVVFDAGRETFRNEIYPEYKANRSECPEDLLKQMPYFRKISSALGLPVMEQPGFEADDIIGTLAKRLSKAGVECVVVSGDKDMMQLVGDSVSVWDTMKDVHYREQEVKDKLGVIPEQVVDLLSLMGDSSDNVPGLRGIGPKTAVQLIEKYGSLEGVLAGASEIAQDPDIRNRKKIAEQIELGGDEARLSKLLVQIKLDVPLELPVSGAKTKTVGKNAAESSHVQLESLDDNKLYQLLSRSEPDTARLHELVDRLEFNSLLKDFDGKLAKSNTAKESDPPIENAVYRVVYKADFTAWAEELKLKSSFAFDLETTSLDVFEARIVGVSFCWSDSLAFYVPINHQPAACTEQQVSLPDFLKALQPVFESPSISKIGQNLKYDIEVLQMAGVTVAGVSFDTMVAAYLLNPDRRSYNLTALAQDFLRAPVQEYEDVVGELENFSYVPIEAATRYACQDAHLAWLLKEKINPLIIEQKMDKLLSETEAPLIPVLARMELAGIKLDVELLKTLSEKMEIELENLRHRLFETAGCEFNINSPKQLSEVLFNKLAISTKGLKKTKTGISTDSSVLEKLAAQHPLPALILKYRSIHKLKSTYVDALPEQVSSRTGRLHTQFNQTQTGTGRLSSSNPNLQNIPIQTEEGRNIRKAFIAEEGKVLISADYSQIELRLLAHMSGDENLIGAFENNLDIHSQTAREIMHLADDEKITPEIRRIGKTINFGIIYGMSGFRLARELEIPVSVANQYIEKYFSNYPRVQELFESWERDASEKGYVTTLFGRRRVIGDIDVSGRDQGFVMRAAINAPLQGTAADLIKMAMVRLDGIIQRDKLPLSMLLQIHDELLFECNHNFCQEAEELVTRIMESVATLRVPLKVETGSGRNWQEAHD